MSAAATGDGGGAERRLGELRTWFQERGHSLYLEQRGDRWIARYPAHGQSIGAGPTATGPTELDAALTAWSAFMDGRR
jgi:hypothetical protein